jgi:hypothetical protein
VPGVVVEPSTYVRPRHWVLLRPKAARVWME